MNNKFSFIIKHFAEANFSYLILSYFYHAKIFYDEGCLKIETRRSFIVLLCVECYQL